ncbi:DegT/DnrJ/EryC1/StrS family aminotransferase [Gaoshiqia sediminis]|uniref:DegT/DnrJ/EryC1/StrS family aminotransferase n=1 Tax=Gaoshiqia sediminis TaxID=2986998 RepID=A0AA42C6M6_9BACT|nr:DegT/DnrJ/EryC1/StrS family aminotransferase [Gaoshiqia sediminis]MCW0482689.1 DegT/DnrJ/EryC1/StrS family aminotransferase [Gaoshiqia sediminis]
MEFCDLKRQYAAYQSELDAAIRSVVQSATFINGDEIRLLEEELAGYLEVKHALACGSGTDALLLSLLALGLCPGDEVICPAFSFIAPASMVALCGGKPVFAEVSPVDFNLDVSRIEEKITSKTRGIIAVSLFGQCAGLDEINLLAAKHGLWVIEDGAQSFGAAISGRKSCGMTDVATTSFFPAKPLGCYGDGGAVFTDNDELAATVRQLRAHGQEKRYHHRRIGINGRMDTLQAAILRVKLRHFDEELKVRQQAAGWYTSLLKGFVETPVVAAGKTSSWAQYTIRSKNRDELKVALAEKNIPSTVHYPLPLPRQEAFAKDVQPGEQFPVSGELCKTVLSLPMHGMITEEEVRKVAGVIVETVGKV